MSYRGATFRSEPAAGLGCIELFCPIFAWPVSHLVHLAGFGPQPVSWTALSTGAVTPSPSAVCVTPSGWRISSGCRWGTAKATVVCKLWTPQGGHLGRETPRVGTVPGTSRLPVALMRWWHQDSPLSHLLGRCLIEEWVPFVPSQWTLTKSWVYSGCINHSSLLSHLYRGFSATGKQIL